MHKLIQRPQRSKVFVIDLRALGRIDAHVAASAPELCQGLPEDVFVFQHGQLLHLVDVVGELCPSEFLDLLKQLQVGALGEVLVTVARFLGVSKSKALRGERVEYCASCVQVLQIFEGVEKIEACTFASVLVTFHTILGLVCTLDLPVELLYADQVECIG